jgi:hypothetical protein
MTFDTPLILVALLLAPLAYFVGRLRLRRIRVEVPSLLLYERALARMEAAAPQAVERRRVVDARLLAEALVLAALVVAAAGPRLSVMGTPRRIGLVIDDTPSMRAAGRPEAAARAEEELRAGLAAEDTMVTARASEAPAGVEDPLAWAALAVSARGVDRTYAITDHALPVEGVTPIIVPGTGRRNRGIIAAGASGNDYLVRTNADDAEVVVIGHRVNVVGVGRGREVRGQIGAVPSEGRITARLSTEDVLLEDDGVELVAPGGPLPVLVRGSVPDSLRRAIAAAGGRVIEERSGPAVLTIVVASQPGEGTAPDRLIAHESARFRFSDPAAQRVRVAPAAVPEALGGLHPLVSDERGRMVVGWREGTGAEGSVVWIGVPLALGDAATDWEKRRGFPVFIAEALGAGAAGEWRAVGLLDERETEEAGALPVASGTGNREQGTGNWKLEMGDRKGRSVADVAVMVAALAVVAAWTMARERACLAY